jgi:Domain of unknown function (DUF1707)
VRLRSHCLAGRIPVDELDRRLGIAMRAETVAELRGLVADLPNDRKARHGVRPDVSAPTSVGPPGIRPFIRQLLAPAATARVRQAVLDTIAPALSQSGFELLVQSDSGLTFERIRRRGWFSVSRERVVFSFEAHGSAETLMIIYGRATRAVRRRFATLSL